MGILLIEFIMRYLTIYLLLFAQTSFGQKIGKDFLSPNPYINILYENKESQEQPLEIEFISCDGKVKKSIKLISKEDRQKKYIKTLISRDKSSVVIQHYKKENGKIKGTVESFNALGEKIFELNNVDYQIEKIADNGDMIVCLKTWETEDDNESGTFQCEIVMLNFKGREILRRQDKNVGDATYMMFSPFGTKFLYFRGSVPIIIDLNNKRDFTVNNNFLLRKINNKINVTLNNYPYGIDDEGALYYEGRNRSDNKVFVIKYFPEDDSVSVGDVLGKP